MNIPSKVNNSIYYTEGISLSSDVAADLFDISVDYPRDKIFLIQEENTRAKCRERLHLLPDIPESNVITLKPGEENKSLAQVQEIWQFLGELKADRKSLIVNVGGGMLTDLAGFAATTFKRGLSFINIPTTLLAMVDASVGGKTGINYRGLKNEIGTIEQPLHVFLSTDFLDTLDDVNYKSGFAEMLKAALIKDVGLWNELKTFDLDIRDGKALTPLLWKAVMVKKEIVDLDPKELSIRKALNFGHTVGHAFESLALSHQRQLMHGFAVAYGMLIESRLSIDFTGLTKIEYDDIREVIIKDFGMPPIEFVQPKALIELMRFDKKNEMNNINFTLLKEIGTVSINNFIDEDYIFDALKF